MLLTSSDIQDFAARWSKARIAALTQSVGAENLDENQLMRMVRLDAREQILKTVFDNSRRFGQSFTRHYGVVLELSDVRTLLPKIGSPCLTGQWHRRDEALVREKTGCFESLRLGSFYCDYWREAIDGLTLGISDDILFARHASCRHGDERCVDVWFEDATKEQRASSKGALPDWVQERLHEIVHRLKGDGVRVQCDGLSEGTLYYQITSANQPSCRDQPRWEKILAAEISKIWPGVMLKNVTPIAVYGDKI